VIGTTVPLWTTKDFREVLQGEWFLPRPSPVGRWEAFVTANVAIRAELLRAIGGFVPSLNIGEDTELCIRLYRAGARVVSDEDWWVRHQVGLPVLALARRYHAYGEARAAVAAAAAVPVPRGIDGSFARRAATFMRIWRSYWQRPAPQSFRRGPVTRARASLAAAVIDYAFLRGLARSNAPAH
jgi:hypothetical protein